MKLNRFWMALALCGATSLQGLSAQQRTASLAYRVEASALAAEGGMAPVWFTANRYGAFSTEAQQAALRAGIRYELPLKRNWRVAAGLELNGGANLVPKFGVQQAYAEVAWKHWQVSVGAKERSGGPLEKEALLSSGWMVEGTNARPIPQGRLELTDYVAVPGTGRWVAVKGHLAYGWMPDGDWQQDFVEPGQYFTQEVRYHSKSLMFRFGHPTQFPVSLELGLITAAQFAGKKYSKQADGSAELVSDMAHGVKDFFKVLIPKQENTLANVSGNHCGSWNFALNARVGSWRLRTYYEHYFEDHSQLFWEYGPWKDGNLGVEVKLPANRWLSTVVWECMSTKDQTGPVLYDGVGGSFGDLQMSGNDHYYNNHEYLGWQYYGASLGHPFLYGPQYNSDGTNYIRSTRVRSHHLGLAGQPSAEWNWRLLASFARHWGTYRLPLDRQRKQFSGLLEVTYRPAWARGWSAAVALGEDRGNYLGNHWGGMLTLRKIGEIKL